MPALPAKLKHMVNQSQLDRVFQALSDPTRRALLERLGRGPLSVSQLAEPMSMTLAAVMQHLQVLEQAELVQSEKTGRVRTCRIEPDGLAAAASWIAQRRGPEQEAGGRRRKRRS